MAKEIDGPVGPSVVYNIEVYPSLIVENINLKARNNRQAKTIDELRAENEALRAQKPGTCGECKWWLEGNEECRKPEAFHQSRNPQPEHPCSECEPKDIEQAADIAAATGGQVFVNTGLLRPGESVTVTNDDKCPTCGSTERFVKGKRGRKKTELGKPLNWDYCDNDEYFLCADPWHDARPKPQPVAHDRNGTALYVGDKVRNDDLEFGGKVIGWEHGSDRRLLIDDGDTPDCWPVAEPDTLLLLERGPNAPKESPND